MEEVFRSTTLHNDTEQWLVGDKEEEHLDYSVLSVGVLTLALLLFVEVLRHKLDGEAACRPFFKVVLEATYSELVTLGLVELFVFLALRYYELKYKERKEVFAEVHFALFYTAIFNAFQSLICGLFTRRVSKAMWVQTEQLELDHYVEIREAFDRVSKEYNALCESQQSWVGFRCCFPAWHQPGLRRRFMTLLAQVRFHELRIQFLESNNLPLTLKVSDYLKKSEESVLMHMVHVSGTAWLLLTGGLNLIYFVEGLVGNVTHDHIVVSNTMMGIFFGMLIFFIVICMILYFKMRYVFERILKMEPVRATDFDLGAQTQRQLFWFSEPQLVISIIQFMQFGYAIALSIVIMFWSDLGEIEAYWYLFATLGCYSLFVFVLSRVLPQYTLCTSLGHLVNKKHLNETLAMHRLQQAQRKQKRRMVQLTFDRGNRDDSIVRLTTDRDKNESRITLEVDHMSITAGASSALKMMPQSGSSEIPSSSAHSMFSQTANSVISNRTEPKAELHQGTKSADLSGMTVSERVECQNSSLLAELVKMDTSALRLQLSAHDKPCVLDREQRKLNGTKGLSDIVPAMRATSAFSAAAMNVDSVETETQTESLKMVNLSHANSVGSSSDGRNDSPNDDDSLPFAPKASEDDGVTLDTNSSIGDLRYVGAPLFKFESPRSVPREESWNAKHVKKFNLGFNKKCLHEFFTSDAHEVASYVFGSFVVFLLIGMRLESFNAITGAIDPSYNTWELRLDIAFWMQATWYIIFIVMSALTMWAVNPSECRSIGEKRTFASAIMDMVLSTVCLTLLFVADWQRCCEDASEMSGLERLLAYDSKKSWIENPVYQECCPFWGFRTFGGYGSIEPFTALIGLRVLRFQLAKMVFQQRSTDEKSSANQEKRSKHRILGNNGHGSGFGCSSSDKGSILEHWQLAINQHPHIVEKYGQFSGELFQAMLGLEIIEDNGPAIKSVEFAETSVTTGTGNTSVSVCVAVTEPSKKEIGGAPQNQLPQHYRYSTLSTECQVVRFAGQQLQQLGSNLAFLSEERTNEEGEQISSAIDVEFQVDFSQLAEEEQDYDSIFIAPNARLTHRMRRCDRRLVPLLRDWTTVDVVMTDYELVYFEVLDDYDSALSPELRRKRESLHRALQVTRGGKGLRLKDVAVGRKVVGHLDLSEVNQIHVERHMPFKDVAHLEAKEARIEVTKNLSSEYWQKPVHTEIPTESRTLRWAKVKEDRLKLVSAAGTLYLRFFSDLDDFEARRQESEAEDELAGVLKKGIALQWAQSIDHICGKDQLKQQLPRYGTNYSEELRHVVFHKPDDRWGHRRHTTFAVARPRVSSQRDLPRNRNSTSHGPSSSHRSYSGTSERVVLDKPKSLQFSNRSPSTVGYAERENPDKPGGSQTPYMTGNKENQNAAKQLQAKQPKPAKSLISSWLPGTNREDSGDSTKSSSTERHRDIDLEAGHTKAAQDKNGSSSSSLDSSSFSNDDDDESSGNAYKTTTSPSKAKDNDEKEGTGNKDPQTYVAVVAASHRAVTPKIKLTVEETAPPPVKSSYKDISTNEELEESKQLAASKAEELKKKRQAIESWNEDRKKGSTRSLQSYMPVDDEYIRGEGRRRRSSRWDSQDTRDHETNSSQASSFSRSRPRRPRAK